MANTAAPEAAVTNCRDTSPLESVTPDSAPELHGVALTPPAPAPRPQRSQSVHGVAAHVATHDSTSKNAERRAIFEDVCC